MNPIKSDAAPVGAGAVVKTRLIHPDPIDFLLVMATRALIYPAARDLAKNLGPDLFPDGAARIVACSLIVDPAPRVCNLTARQQMEVDRLLWAVEHATVPDDEAWAVHCIRLLAEHQYAPLLAGTLRWAATETDSGAPVRWLRSRVVNALDVAEGIRAFDLTAAWEGEAA